MIKHGSFCKFTRSTIQHNHRNLSGLYKSLRFMDSFKFTIAHEAKLAAMPPNTSLFYHTTYTIWISCAVSTTQNISHQLNISSSSLPSKTGVALKGLLSKFLPDLGSSHQITIVVVRVTRLFETFDLRSKLCLNSRKKALRRRQK